MDKSQFLDLSIDPIQELIGKQLSSISLEGIYTFKKGSGQVSPSPTSRVCSTNSIEDMFIEAIDKKYHRKARSGDIIRSLLVGGLTINDISQIMNINQKTVRRISRLVVEGCDGED